MRLGLRSPEARARDFSFNQEVNLEAKKNLWDCLTYLAGRTKRQSGSKGNLHLVNIIGVPVAMTYLGLVGGRVAGLPGDTHWWAHGLELSGWSTSGSEGHFGEGMNLRNLMLWISSCFCTMHNYFSTLALGVGHFWPHSRYLVPV